MFLPPWLVSEYECFSTYLTLIFKADKVILFQFGSLFGRFVGIKINSLFHIFNIIKYSLWFLVRIFTSDFFISKTHIIHGNVPSFYLDVVVANLSFVRAFSIVTLKKSTGPTAVSSFCPS